MWWEGMDFDCTLINFNSLLCEETATPTTREIEIPVKDGAQELNVKFIIRIVLCSY